MVRARHRFKTVVSVSDNGTPAHRSNDRLVDDGLLTIITLDGAKGAPGNAAVNDSAAQKLTGRQNTDPGTDIQGNLRADEAGRAIDPLPVE